MRHTEIEFRSRDIIRDCNAHETVESLGIVIGHAGGETDAPILYISIDAIE